MPEYAVIWHSMIPKLVGLTDSIKKARAIRNEWRKTHETFVISINREVE